MSIIITLPSGSDSKLNWGEQQRSAHEAARSGKQLIWELDFCWRELLFSPSDPSLFLSLTIALDEFVNAIYSAFHAQTSAVLLYRGSCDLTACFPRTYWEEPFAQWLTDLMRQATSEVLPLPQTHYYRLYAMQAFSELLQRLLSSLSDQLRVCALFEQGELSDAVTAQLLSKERFEHIEVVRSEEALMRPENPSGVGVCLPTDAFCDSSVLQELDSLLGRWRKEEKTFRILSEAKLTDEWAELETLWVIPRALTPQGKRKLQGFLAAGGRVVENLIGAEGFEPPTHCSQSSCASQTALCSD